MFTQVQKVVSGALNQVPPKDIGAAAIQESQDSFEECLQGKSATQLGCAALIGGSKS